jgi:RNA 2',3'-cyclic 3'-phosphodiesterase
MRLFVALDIDDVIRKQIARFVEGVCNFAPDARWVHPESLHVTLKFIGERSLEEKDRIHSALASVQASVFDLSFRGHGFFPTPRAPRVFWIGIEGGPELVSLASAVDQSLSPLGIAREDHPFNPHLTLARGAGVSGTPRWRKGDRPNAQFTKLQEKLAARPAPDFGTMAAREFFLYQSKLSPGGSQYTKLAVFPLTKKLSPTV